METPSNSTDSGNVFIVYDFEQICTDELRHRSNEEGVWACLYGLSLHRYQSCVPICV